MPFVKGQSGNPKGRPSGKSELGDLAREYGPSAIRKLAYWMDSDDGRVSVMAAGMLLDRGYGRPMQTNEHSGLDGAPLMPTLSVTLTNQQLPAPVVKTIDGNSERG